MLSDDSIQRHIFLPSRSMFNIVVYCHARPGAERAHAPPHDSLRAAAYLPTSAAVKSVLRTSLRLYRPDMFTLAMPFGQTGVKSIGFQIGSTWSAPLVACLTVNPLTTHPSGYSASGMHRATDAVPASTLPRHRSTLFPSGCQPAATAPGSGRPDRVSRCGTKGSGRSLRPASAVTVWRSPFRAEAVMLKPSAIDSAHSLLIGPHRARVVGPAEFRNYGWHGERARMAESELLNPLCCTMDDQVDECSDHL
jgi:hypothetical protein